MEVVEFLDFVCDSIFVNDSCFFVVLYVFCCEWWDFREGCVGISLLLIILLFICG